MLFVFANQLPESYSDMTIKQYVVHVTNLYIDALLLHVTASFVSMNMIWTYVYLYHENVKTNVVIFMLWIKYIR